MYMKNLLDETLECLKENNKDVFDIKWISVNNNILDWSEFESVANTEYNSGYGYFGKLKVNNGLVIVGDDWWLERKEGEDASQWWEFKTLPMKPESYIFKLNSEHIFEKCG